MEAARAVAHGGAQDAARARHRALEDREDHDLAAPRPDRLAARLLARQILDQEELAALEVDPRPAQHRRRLEGEGEGPVKVAVETVVAARAVVQQQRRRLALAGGAATPAVGLKGRRVARLAPHLLVHAVGERCQAAIEGAAQGRDQGRQGLGEVGVIALAEAVAGHVDAAPEAAIVGVEGD